MPFRTSNPAMKESAFAPAQTWDDLKRQGRDTIPGVDTAGLEAAAAGAASAPGASETSRTSRGGVKTMTIGGTAGKTLFLLAVCVTAACLTWGYLLPWDAKAGVHAASLARSPVPFLLGGLLGGFVLALATCLRPRWAIATAPFYALAEGCFVGSASAIYAVNFATSKDGLLQPNYAMIFQAMGLTFGVLAAMLGLYATRIIKPTEKLKTGIVACTLGVGVVYLASMVLQIFGLNVPYIHQSGPIGIAFSGVVIVIAAFNFILDFDVIEQGVRNGAPARMEWYGGFALLVTLVWLYLEILRLLSKIRSQE